MRRSHLPITLVTLVVFLAIAVYIGYYIYNSVTDTMRTVSAEYVTMGDSVGTSGVLVRQESLVAGGGGYELVTASEGEKVAKGETLAVRYSSEDALDVASKLSDLRLQAEQIHAIIQGGSAGTYALSSVVTLSSDLRGGRLSALDSDAVGISTYIFSGGYAYDELESTYTDLQTQISQLEAQASSGSDAVTAGQPGIFSAYTDGYEYLNADSLADLTPSGADALLSAPQTVPSDALGKLITGNDWYYVTVMDTADAKRLTAGKSMSLSFSRTYGETLRMTVTAVSAEENGRCAVVFSSNRYISQLTKVRELYGEVQFDSVSGYSIPLEALHMDDSGTYLYIITGLQAEKVYVTVQSETDTSYIVTDTGTGKLTAGVEVIAAANDLYDGKVVR